MTPPVSRPTCRCAIAGTVAGSLAHADPAGDWPAALMALDTEVTITGPRGVRDLSARCDFIVDAYTTQLGRRDGDGLSVGIPPQTEPAGRTSSSRSGQATLPSRASAFSSSSTATAARSVAVSLGALGARPIRARPAEQLLTEQMPAPDVLRDAQTLVCEAAQPFDDTRGSVEYKRHLAGVLFRRAFDVSARSGTRVRARHDSTIYLRVAWPEALTNDKERCV